MSAVADKLREARALIEQGWCKHVFALIGDRGEKCFCTTGAIAQALENTCYAEDLEGDARFDEIIDTMASAVAASPNWQAIADWNDAPGRTQAEVISAFDKAIELAEREPA